MTQNHIKVLLLTVLSTMALSSSALAQQATLEGYAKLVSALDSAVKVQAGNPGVSLDRLEEASNLYRKFASEVGSPVLAQGVSTVLSRARQAVTRSSADLAAQVGLVRGLLRRALQDELLDATEERSALAPRLATTLATDLGLDATGRNRLRAFVAAGDAEGTRKIVQRFAAQKMAASLDAANSSDKNRAYLGMAGASSWFMSVQGSPEAANLSTGAFNTALGELTRNNRAAFNSQKADLRSSSTALAGSLNSSATPNPSTATVPQTPVVVPETPETPTTGTPTTGMPTTGTPPTPQTPVTPASPLSSADKVYPPLVRALTAASSADVIGARSLLLEAQQAFESGLGKSLVGQDPAANNRILERFRTLQDGMSSVGMRLMDIQNLMSDISSADDAMLDKTTLASSLSSGVGGVWQGWTRSLVFIVIAGLAFLPLRYLNLAFGGRNRYWRYIGIAMVLLFVPVLFEGLAHLGSVLAEVSGVRFFDALSNLSVLQNSTMQLLWALTLLAAVGFAIAGFRGICIQFGLIRVRGQNFTTTQLDTNATTTGGTSAGSGKNTFEWDEEF